MDELSHSYSGVTVRLQGLDIGRETGKLEIAFRLGLTKAVTRKWYQSSEVPVPKSVPKCQTKPQQSCLSLLIFVRGSAQSVSVSILRLFRDVLSSPLVPFVCYQIYRCPSHSRGLCCKVGIRCSLGIDQ